MLSEEKLDAPIRGAAAIAEAARIHDEKGRPDARKAYYALECGHIDASKFGRKWITTLRRIRAGYIGEVAK
jgi:hypothetical protein